MHLQESSDVHSAWHEPHGWWWTLTLTPAALFAMSVLQQDINLKWNGRAIQVLSRSFFVVEMRRIKNPQQCGCLHFSIMITGYLFSEMNCIIIRQVSHVFSDTLKPYLREESHLVEWDLPINVSYMSAIIHLRRLYVIMLARDDIYKCCVCTLV